MHFHRDMLAICDGFARNMLRRERRGSLHRLGAAGLHLRLRRRAVPDAHRRVVRWCWKRPARTICRRRSSTYKATVCFTAPTSYRAMIGKIGKHDISSLAQMRVGRRDAAEGDLRGLARRDRHQADRRHRRDRDAAHLHQRRPRTRSAPAPPASRCRATRPRSSTTTGNDVPAGTIGRLAVRGPTGCRYLADERQTQIRARTAGTSPATPI